VLVMREEIEEARESNDEVRMQSIRKEITGRREVTLNRIAEIARGLECWQTRPASSYASS